MQSKNKNDGVQFPTRYWAYDFAKRHIGGFGGRKVFPIGNTGETNNEQDKKLPEQISNTIRTNYGGGYSNKTYTLGRKESYAIDANYHKGTNTLEKGRRQMVLDGRIRRLTPRECERLMGLKDDWTAEGVDGKISDTQRYKLCGNGVVVNVVEEVIHRLLDK